jgi:hypothetical protein
MEKNLSKLDNMTTMNPYDTFDYNSYEQQNRINYWEKPKVNETQTKKKKISFNDILTNMNLVINKQGVLQFMGPNKEQPQNVEQNYNYNSTDFTQQSQYQQHPYQQQHYQQQYQQPQENKNSEPVDLSVKHSYIYNKYFKDYADPNTSKQGPRVPKTMEEYRQMILDDKIKKIQHRQMLEQVKSKKMMFTSAPSVVSNPINIQASRNNLGSMNFR